jgi:hypothetical protein
MSKVLYQDRIREVPEIHQRTQYVEKPQVILKEKIVEVPQVQTSTKFVEKNQVVLKERVVEVPQVQVRDRIVEVPQFEEKIRHVPKIINQEVVRHVPGPVQVNEVVKYQETFSKKIVDKFVENVQFKQSRRTVMGDVQVVDVYPDGSPAPASSGSSHTVLPPTITFFPANHPESMANTDCDLSIPGMAGLFKPARMIDPSAPAPPKRVPKPFKHYPSPPVLQGQPMMQPQVYTSRTIHTSEEIRTNLPNDPFNFQSNTTSRHSSSGNSSGLGSYSPAAKPMVSTRHRNSSSFVPCY